MRYGATPIDVCQCDAYAGRMSRTAPATLADLCCAPVLAGPLDQASAEQLAAGYKVLADPARLRLLSLVGAAGELGACTCDLVEPVGLSQPTVSHHLGVLHDAGLVSRRKDGRNTYYAVRPAALAALRDALGPAMPTPRLG
jgi:ArsR family transcriptional regulator, arsenate/arsenite/antimonite-responsive transcriptional repressor